MKRTKVQRSGSAPMEKDRQSSWLTRTVKRAAQTLLLGAAIFGTAWCGTAQAQPTPTWPLPGFPNTDGGYQYPLWKGESYMDSAASTGANRLHAIGIRGQGVSVAVMDSPVDTDNSYINKNFIAEASAAANVVNHSVNMYEYSNTMASVENLGGGFELYFGTGKDAVQLPTTVTSYGYSHGTHVSGTVVGMAPDAGLIQLNTNGWSDPVDRTDASLNILQNYPVEYLYKYAANIASDYNLVALNGSYTLGAVFDNQEDADAASPTRAIAIQEMINAGIVPVFASGNNGFNNYIGTPAAMSDTVAVGALHPWGLITSFSNQSVKVVLLAPGEDIVSSRPTWSNVPLQFQVGDNELELMGGTSMASPHVTGAVALLSSGARMASTQEILQSMVDSADQVTYDGDLLIPASFVDPSLPDTLMITMDQARNLIAGFNQPELEQVEYRFLRADKAFMNLTHKRTDKIADRIDAVGSGLSGIMYAYADELGSDINGHAAQIFQRLDALDPASQFLVARQMSPRFANAVAESAHYGIVGLHRSFGRRSELNRLGQGANPASCNPCDQTGACAPCSPCGNSGVETTGWVEGFGGGFDRSYSNGSGSYDGHFAGTSFGLERKRKNVTYGLFGNWSDHRVSGDGKADGDWGTFGAYGRIDRRRSFVEGSIAGSFGDYDMTRNIVIPGVVFTGNQPGTFVFDWAPDMFEQAKSKFDTQSVSFRLAGGRDLWRANGWIFGPRAEMSMSYLSMDSYTERGADSLNLHVNRYKSTYLEGGFGLFAGKCFVMNKQRFIATGKLMGMAGGTMGGDMYGQFVNNGSAFRVNPNHTTTGWIVPEATLAWNLRDGVVLSGSYAGRFGEKYSENSGSLALSLYW